MRDPLEILDLAKGATKRAIKKSYRTLSKRFHPDLNQNNPEAEARFREIQSPYEALSGLGRLNNLDHPQAQRSRPADVSYWSEEPFAGFFAAKRAYTEATRSRSREKVSQDEYETSQDHDQ